MLTKFDVVKEDAMLVIGELNKTDDHFGFDHGKYLGFKNKIGK